MNLFFPKNVAVTRAQEYRICCAITWSVCEQAWPFGCATRTGPVKNLLVFSVYNSIPRRSRPVSLIAAKWEKFDLTKERNHCAFVRGCEASKSAPNRPHYGPNPTEFEITMHLTIALVRNGWAGMRAIEVSLLMQGKFWGLYLENLFWALLAFLPVLIAFMPNHSTRCFAAIAQSRLILSYTCTRKPLTASIV